jgi:hypothetical protein
MNLKQIVAHVDRELARLGFVRKGPTWNRSKGDLVEVIDVQLSTAGNSVTINAGVLARSTHMVCWGRDAGTFVEEPECTVRARVGQLIDGKDCWWDLVADDASQHITDSITDRILPFVDRMGSMEAMRDWLLTMGAPSRRWPLPTVYYAIIESQLGARTLACEVLEDLERSALGGWKTRAREVATRLGCAIREDS